MPISDGMGLVFAVTSYDGKIIIAASCREQIGSRFLHSVSGNRSRSTFNLRAAPRPRSRARAKRGKAKVPAKAKGQRRRAA
jgi:hypothetical protein